ncbi:MAG: hypothetical protein ACO1N2_03225 [Candidatus Saccharimonadota bacterium]|jgi:hypothetical protein
MHTGGPVTHVVKNGGRRHPEVFSAEKLHKSIVGALLSSGGPSGHAESIARRVVGDVSTWLENRPEVTSADLRRVAARSLKTYHPDASYLYEHHRSTL